MSITNNTVPTPATATLPTANAGISMAPQQINDLAAFGTHAEPGADIVMTATTNADSAVLAAILAQSIDNNNAAAGQALLKALKGDTAEGNVAQAAAIALQDQLAPATGTMPLEPVDVIQPGVEIAPSPTILDKLGLLKLTHAEFKQLAAEANSAALERLKVEVDDLAQYCVMKIDELRVHESAFIARLKAKYAHGGLQRGLSQAGSHAAGGYAVDKNGQKPVVGTTYKHPTTGKEWTKTQPQGTVKQAFLKMIEAGHTWEELKVNP